MCACQVTTIGAGPRSRTGGQNRAQVSSRDEINIAEDADDDLGRPEADDVEQ